MRKVELSPPTPELSSPENSARSSSVPTPEMAAIDLPDDAKDSASTPTERTISAPVEECACVQVLKVSEGTLVVDRRLGHGTFAVVWGGGLKLSHGNTFRIAVKIPHEDKWGAVEMLVHEAHVYAALESKSAPIPHFYGLFSREICTGPSGSYSLVLEAAGEALVSFKQRDLCRQRIFLAFQLLHELGVKHNDVRPQNVLRNLVDGSVRIIDFGLAELEHRCVKEECSELHSLRTMLGMTNDEWATWTSAPAAPAK